VIEGLVSVIIPTYNRATSVLEAIDSVRAQTYSSKEIIVVDDGSTDRTAAVVTGLEDVRYVLQQRAGPATARTRGLQLAHGEFIASLDSDDLWTPMFLDQSVAAISASGLDLVFANWGHESGEPSYFSRREASGQLARFCGDHRDGWCVLTPAQVREMFLDSCLAPSSSMLLRRSSMPSRWNPKMLVADDWYLILEMSLTKPCRAAFTTAPLWLKRTDGNNRYDGQSFGRVIRDLYFHDHAQFRRDFRHRLSRRERTRLALRQLGYLAFLDCLRAWVDALTLRSGVRLRRRRSRTNPPATG